MRARQATPGAVDLAAADLVRRGVLFGPLAGMLVGAASMLGDSLNLFGAIVRCASLKWATYTSTRFTGGGSGLCGASALIATSRATLSASLRHDLWCRSLRRRSMSCHRPSPSTCGLGDRAVSWQDVRPGHCYVRTLYAPSLRSWLSVRRESHRGRLRSSWFQPSPRSALFSTRSSGSSLETSPKANETLSEQTSRSRRSSRRSMLETVHGRTFRGCRHLLA